MKIDRVINFFLTLIFGTRPDGDRNVWFHSQNLNEDRDGDPKGLPWHGRCWLRTYQKNLFMFSWNLWTSFCGISIEADPEDGGTMLHLAFPPFSFWLSLPFGPKKHQYSDHVYFNLRVFNWALWWQFGGDSMSWDSKTPKWRHGSFDLRDFLLGDRKYSAEVLEIRDMVIHMPEGDYAATGVLERCTWKRPRWFALVRTSITVSIPKGIPHEGKGENSWDCGEDGLFGYGYEGKSWRDAADRGTQIVLESRKKYNGNRMAKYPDPALRGMTRVDNTDLNDLLMNAKPGPT